MNEIQYIQQPTEYLCGQACVAMIANVSVDDVILVMNNDKATGKKDIERALEHYGIRQAKTMTKADNSTPLPPVCILKVLLPAIVIGYCIIMENTMILNLGLQMNCIVKPKSSHIWNCMQTNTGRCLWFFFEQQSF